MKLLIIDNCLQCPHHKLKETKDFKIYTCTHPTVHDKQIGEEGCFEEESQKIPPSFCPLPNS